MNLALPILLLVFETLLAHFQAGGKTNHPIVTSGLALATQTLVNAGITPAVAPPVK